MQADMAMSGKSLEDDWTSGDRNAASESEVELEIDKMDKMGGRTFLIWQGDETGETGENGE